MADPRPEPRRRSALRRLAEYMGIIAEYVDQSGTERRVTSDETRVRLLAAWGIDASDESAAANALAHLQSRERERSVEPVRVVMCGSPSASHIEVRAPKGADSVGWSLELVREGGDRFAADGRADRLHGGKIRIPLPAPLPEGYHGIRVSLDTQSGGEATEQLLIVVPRRAPSVRDRTGRRRATGVIVNLYSVQSERNWGIGDASDLAVLLEWTGRNGGDFVGVNPLHALRNRGIDVSPYSPVSRLFRNVAYIDVEAVPELAHSGEARALIEHENTGAELAHLRAAGAVAYERVVSEKRPVLELLFNAFLSLRSNGLNDRAGAFDAWAAERGARLDAFATFEALADELREGNWQAWPEEFRDPRSPDVQRFLERGAWQVDFHRWLQFEVDRQIGEAVQRGRTAGLDIGLYQDLAIGTSPGGADVWANPGLFVNGAAIGAPPDAYSASGQNWGLAPLDPHALREDRYRFWIDLVRASLRHAGAFRLDHAAGLFRQFWIPQGADGRDGAYVRYPADDLLGILVLEARRHGALVVGEDLGTVPPEIPPKLHRRGIHSSRVLYFEKDDDEFRPPGAYERAALVTANTHDMPTLAGWWAGRDIELKAAVGMIDEAAAAGQREARSRERAQLVARLTTEGLLDGNAEPTSADIRAAVHAFLLRTPAALIGFSLDDLLGEQEPVNLPGAPPECFEAWTRTLTVPLEQIVQLNVTGLMEKKE